jgi:hypothetical protein
MILSAERSAKKRNKKNTCCQVKSGLLEHSSFPFSTAKMVALWSLVAGFASLQLARATGPQIVQDLQALLSSTSEIVLTSDASYTADFTQRFSVSKPPSYVVAVKPVTVTDVQQVV